MADAAIRALERRAQADPRAAEELVDALVRGGMAWADAWVRAGCPGRDPRRDPEGGDETLCAKRGTRQRVLRVVRVPRMMRRVLYLVAPSAQDDYLHDIDVATWRKYHRHDQVVARSDGAPVRIADPRVGDWIRDEEHRRIVTVSDVTVADNPEHPVVVTYRRIAPTTRRRRVRWPTRLSISQWVQLALKAREKSWE